MKPYWAIKKSAYAHREGGAAQAHNVSELSDRKRVGYEHDVSRYYLIIKNSILALK